MPHLEDEFLAGDGTRLYEQCWLPETPARAVVAVMHGFIEHSGRYAQIAERLSRRGYAVYAADLRGHGRSGGPRCFARSFDQYLDDLGLLLERIRRRESEKPLFLFGHSMGGLIITLYPLLRQTDVRGLVLSAAVLRVGDHVYPRLRRLASLVGRLFPWLRVVRLGVGYISRDPQTAADFLADPLVFHGRFPVRTGAELLRATRLLSDSMESVRLPLLILHGAGDRAADPDAARELCRRAASSDKTLRIYDSLYHAIFWEPEREQVMADLIAWLDART